MANFVNGIGIVKVKPLNCPFKGLFSISELFKICSSMSILKRLFVQSLHQIGQTLKIYPSLGQTCPTPFDFWKVPFWTPEKVQFWFLKKTPLKIFFFMFLLWFSFKNKRRTNILLVGIFRSAQKKLLTVKMPFWPFLAVF